MEQLLLVVVAVAVVVVLGLRRPRDPSPPAPTRPRPATAALPSRTSPLPGPPRKGALDPDDPDGAFMDGYVSGRYTERWSRPAAGAAAVATGAVAAGALDEEDDVEDGVDGVDGVASDYDAADHSWGDPWSGDGHAADVWDPGDDPDDW